MLMMSKPLFMHSDLKHLAHCPGGKERELIGNSGAEAPSIRIFDNAL